MRPRDQFLAEVIPINEDDHRDERWKTIKGFSNYLISNHGNVQAERSERILALSQNQYGVVNVGLMKDGVQYHRSVPLLVANAFLSRAYEAFDTPINLDGDRWNNRADNIVWRPRWFAIKYVQQFKWPPDNTIFFPLEDIKTGEISENSFECAKRYGLLENDLVQSVMKRTYVWPTYQQFRVIQE